MKQIYAQLIIGDTWKKLREIDEKQNNVAKLTKN